MPLRECTYMSRFWQARYWRRKSPGKTTR